MKESECVVSRILTKILRQKIMLAPCFEPSTFRLLLLTLVWGGPSCCCHSHSFGRQQANLEPVHPERLTTHLLGLHSPTTVPSYVQDSLK